MPYKGLIPGHEKSHNAQHHLVFFKNRMDNKDLCGHANAMNQITVTVRLETEVNVAQGGGAERDLWSHEGHTIPNLVCLFTSPYI
jgi:hypothetical protein